MTVLTLARHNVMLVRREPGPALSRILSPLVLMPLMLEFFRQSMPHDVAVARAVVVPLILFSMLGLSVVGNSLLNERIWHTLERLRATPARGASLLAGKAAAPLGILLVQQLAVFTVGVIVFGLRPKSPLLLGLAGLTWAVTVLCLGAAMASVLRTTSAMSAATDLASLLSTTLSGALVPLGDLPGWVHAVAPVSPGYWAVHAFNGALRGSVPATLTACAVLAGISLAAGTFAARRLVR